MHYINFIIILIFLLLSEILYRQLIIKYSLPRQTSYYTPIVNVIFILLALMAAIRAPIVGNDTQNYINLYNDVVNTQLYSDFLMRYEAGYIWLNRMCGHVSKNPQTIIIVSAMITTIGYMYFFKKYSKSICLSIIMFICLRYYDQTLNIIRECIAICIILYSFKYILRRKFLQFCICISIAFLFHKTAIIFIFAWWISKLRLTTRNLCLFFLLSIIFAIQFGAIFQQLLMIFETYSYYDGGEYFGETRIATYLMLILQCLFFSIALVIRKKYVSDINKDDNIMLLLWFCGICILLVSTQFNLLDRIATYFNVFSLVAFPNTISLIKKRTNKYILYSGIIFVLFSYYIFILEFRPSWNRIYPYEMTSLTNLW